MAKTDNIYTEWTVDVGGTLVNLQKFEKKIKAAEAAEKKLANTRKYEGVITAQMTTKEMALAISRHKSAEATKKAAAASSRLAGAKKQLLASLTSAVTVGNLATSAISALGQQFRETWKDATKLTNVSKAFTGNLKGLRKATSGLVSDFDLMTMRNNLFMAGIEMTDAELEDMLGALNKVSAATGKELAYSVDSAMEALTKTSAMRADNVNVIMSETEAYKALADQLGINVNQLSETQKKLAFKNMFVQKLTANADQLNEREKTFSDELERVATNIGNVTTKLMANINASKSAASVTRDLGSAFNFVARKAKDLWWGLGELKDEINAIKKRIDSFTPKWAQNFTKTVKGVVNRFLNPGGVFWDKTVGKMNRAEADFQTQKIMSSLLAEKDMKTRNVSDSDILQGDTAIPSWLRKKTDYTGQGFRGIKSGRGGSSNMGSSDRQGILERWANEQVNTLKLTAKVFMEIVKTKWEANKVVGKAEQKQKLRTEETFRAGGMEDASFKIQNMNQSLLDQKAIISDNAKMWNEQIGTNNLVRDSFHEMAGGIWQMLDAAITSGENFPKAMFNMVKGTLLSIASQATVKALFYKAEGTAMLSNPFTAWMAPGYFTASAMMWKTAALAGGGGLAMSGIGAAAGISGGGGGDSQDKKYGNKSYKPTFGQKKKREQPININVYIGDERDPSAILYGKQQIQTALAAA